MQKFVLQVFSFQTDRTSQLHFYLTFCTHNRAGSTFLLWPPVPAPVQALNPATAPSATLCSDTEAGGATYFPHAVLHTGPNTDAAEEEEQEDDQPPLLEDDGDDHEAGTGHPDGTDSGSSGAGGASQGAGGAGQQVASMSVRALQQGSVPPNATVRRLGRGIEVYPLKGRAVVFW